jgi:Mrp family chromosome partitioning ATPase
MSTHTISRRRPRWKRTALTALTVLLLSFAALYGIRLYRVRSAIAVEGDITTEKRSANDIAIESLSRKITTDNQQRQELKATRAQQASAPPRARAVVLPPAEIRRKLVGELIRLLSLEEQYPEGSPEITDTRKQIDSLQSQIAQMPVPVHHAQSVVFPATTETETQIAETDRQLSLNKAQTRNDIQQLSQLIRAKELVSGRRSRHGDLSIFAITSISLLLGLIAGALVFSMSLRYNIAIPDEAALRQLLPQTVEFLSTVPHLDGDDSHSRRDVAKFFMQGSAPDSAGGIRYAQMVDRLLAIKDSSHQVLVTSADAGDGRSVTAVNLAYAFHVRNIPVLLAELSFERPVFADIFGPSPIFFGVGDAVALGHPLDSVVCERVDGLKVALAGETKYSSDSLYPSSTFDQFLFEARTAYDWTILDGPSVESAPQIASLAKAVGITVVVARARETPSEDLVRAIARINDPMTLVVLNDL